MCSTKKMAPQPPLNVRRSSRASLPDTYLMYRRQIIRENFCKTAVQTIKKKPNGKFTAIKSKISAKVQNKNYNNTKKKQYIDRQTKQTKLLNGNGCSDSGGDDNTADALTLPPPTFDDELTSDKTEKLDETTDETGIPKSFGN